MATPADPVRVLIVDDQEAFRSAARMVIELTDGFTLAGEATSGEEALRLIDELAPDLVLMDIKMPGVDPLEAIRLIAAEHGAVRVVAVSTYEEYAPVALQAGAAAFVGKSEFDSGRLVATWADVR